MTTVLALVGPGGARRLVDMAADADPRLTVVGTVDSADQAVARIRGERPDVVVVDLACGGDPVTVARTVLEADPNLRVLALGGQGDGGLVPDLLRLGVGGFLVDASAEDVAAGVAEVADGRRLVARSAVGRLVAELERSWREETECRAASGELERMKRRFVAMITDELRTPLTVGRGTVQTLRRGWDRLDDAARDDLLHRLEAQLARLHRRIEQVLVVAGIESGLVAGGAAAFDLDGVAREVVGRYDCAEGRITTALEPVRARADRATVTAVATVLVDNALEHTRGGVRVSVAARGGRACLSVLDEGPGLDADALVRLLDEPFSSAAEVHTRTGTGLGLSLYIAARQLESMDGSLEVVTDPEGGSEFTAALPLAGERA